MSLSKFNFYIFFYDSLDQIHSINFYSMDLVIKHNILIVFEFSINKMKIWKQYLHVLCAFLKSKTWNIITLFFNLFFFEFTNQLMHSSKNDWIKKSNNK